MSTSPLPSGGWGGGAHGAGVSSEAQLAGGWGRARGDGLLVPDLAIASPRKASLLPMPPPQLWADTWGADKVVQ